MKQTSVAIAFAVFVGAIIHAKETSKWICPAGYSLIGELCISDTTGDIVLPTTSK